MFSIESILTFIKNGILRGDDRFTIIDHEHILDTKTGVKLHLYDDWFKLTYDDETIAKMSDFTPSESQTVNDIRKSLITPEQELLHSEQYPLKMKERRLRLSELYANPKPIMDKYPSVEGETEEYNG